ncbi:hypothetical protein A6302_03264 [Methylobrevis pamukkalensis]|uniref:Uncharacterized protein n=1 Tax=Methylobrevis pamukkalensis TaxID=1439726 RepID=A0A1E3H0T2_9HYPH|nr:hypothetical protein A6302_03264 [Methylobrevis pamukkalensis]
MKGAGFGRRPCPTKFVAVPAGNLLLFSAGEPCDLCFDCHDETIMSF